MDSTIGGYSRGLLRTRGNRVRRAQKSASDRILDRCIDPTDCAGHAAALPAFYGYGCRLGNLTMGGANGTLAVSRKTILTIPMDDLA